MKRLLRFFHGHLVGDDQIPNSELLIAACVQIAHVPQPDGSAASLYVDLSGMPMLLVREFPESFDRVYLPPYQVLDDLCSKQSFDLDGQAFLITDILVRSKKVNFPEAYRLKKELTKNLEARTFSVMIDR